MREINSVADIVEANLTKREKDVAFYAIMGFVIIALAVIIVVGIIASFSKPTVR